MSVKPTYAHISFEIEGKTIPGSARWFETTNEHEARGYVAGYNIASQIVKARLVEIKPHADEPPSDMIQKLIDRS